MCGLSVRTAHFGSMMVRSLLKGQKLSPIKTDRQLGYPCGRRLIKFSTPDDWLTWLDQRLQDYQPDVVMGHNSPMCPLLNHAAKKGYPTFYFVRELSSIESGIFIPDHIYPIANSPFAASQTETATNNPVGVVLPFIDLDDYHVEKRDRRYITFINPVPEKGVELAIETARQLPNENFLFVKGKWTRYDYKQQESFIQEAYKLPNIRVINHQKDMRTIYKITDILLVPSQFTETFGRVILEAQVNRIPVVAAYIGGIPYTLGKGGLLVDPVDKPDGYIQAIQHLRHHEDAYNQLSHLAYQNSQRAEFDPQYQVEQFLNIVQNRTMAMHT